MEDKKFVCSEETTWYSHSLQYLALNKCGSDDVILELGMGDATPVIDALIRSSFAGTIHGYEINPNAHDEAVTNIKKHDLGDRYVPHLGSFFDTPDKPDAKIFISSPPYIPAHDNNIMLPHLHGGLEGIDISKKMLDCGYETVFLLMASYGNPQGLIKHAQDRGYNVEDFLVTPMPFGCYSSESKVLDRIREMQRDQLAFYSENMYLVASVVFRKRASAIVDLSEELTKVLRSL